MDEFLKEQENIEGEGQAQGNAVLPMIPIRGRVVFPLMSVHFDIGREKSIRALNLSLERNSIIFLAAQKDSRHSDPTPGQIHSVGTAVKIKQVLKMPGENVRALVRALPRKDREIPRDRHPF